MTAPTLADRILVALANEPMSEADFRVSFPKTSLEAIRTKLGELRAAGQIVERDGVYRIPPGKSVAPEAVAKVEAAAVEARAAEKRAETIGVTAAAAQRRPAPAAPRERAAPARQKHCGACDTTKPETEFYRNRSTADGLSRQCKPCANAAVAASHAKKLTGVVAKQPTGRASKAPTKRSTKRRAPDPVAAAEPRHEASAAATSSAPLVAVRRTWTLAFRDVHGIVREFTLDEATRAAALEALQA
jgi:hypothetical protein